MPDAQIIEKDIAIMFTGGLDTSLAACQLASKYKRLHLLTFSNGVCVRLNTASERAKEIGSKVGEEKVIHHMIDVTELFSELKESIVTDFKKYKSPLIFDLCCRLSMEAATIIYCVNNNISYAADGNNAAQDQIFIQQMDYIKKADKLFNDYGIEYIHPAYGFEERIKRKEKLKQYNLNSGYTFLEKISISSQLINQPFCLWAPVSFLFTSPLRKFFLFKWLSLSLDKAIELRIKKEKLTREYIKRHINTIKK